jgi:hypothetical protein
MITLKQIEEDFVRATTKVENGIVKLAKSVETDAVAAEKEVVAVVQWVAANNGVIDAAANVIIKYIHNIQANTPAKEALVRIAVSVVGGIEAAVDFIVKDQNVIIEEAKVILDYIVSTAEKAKTVVGSVSYPAGLGANNVGK